MPKKIARLPKKEYKHMHDIWNPWHGCRKCSEGVRKLLYVFS